MSWAAILVPVILPFVFHLFWGTPCPDLDPSDPRYPLIRNLSRLLGREEEWEGDYFELTHKPTGTKLNRLHRGSFGEFRLWVPGDKKGQAHELKDYYDIPRFWRFKLRAMARGIAKLRTAERDALRADKAAEAMLAVADKLVPPPPLLSSVPPKNLKTVHSSAWHLRSGQCFVVPAEIFHCEYQPGSHQWKVSCK